MRRIRTVLLALLVAGATLSIVAAPGHAGTRMPGEAWQTNDWIGTDDVTGGHDDDVGYNRNNNAPFNEGGRPDCILATGKSPSGPAASSVPVGVKVRTAVNQARRPDRHQVYAAKQTGSAMPSNYEYWIHAAQDNGSDTDTLCAHASVTTDSTGYFSVTFPRTLAAAPVAVTWMPTEEPAGTDFPTTNLVVDGSMTSTGFQGRAAYGSTFLNNKAIQLDYWAVTNATQSETDPAGMPYEHVAGVALVTTDSDGNATINHADLSGAAMGGQVTGGVFTGDDTNLPGGVILFDAGSTQSIVHVRKGSGTVLANEQITLYYIITSGSTGGGITASGWGNAPFQQFGEEWGTTTRVLCTSLADVTCWRYPDIEVLGTITYGIDSAYLALGQVHSREPEAYLADAMLEWSTSDVDVPAWSRDTTPDGNEVLDVTTDNLGAGICAQLATDRTTPNDSGLTSVVTQTFTHTNALAFGPAPILLSEDCPIEHVNMHELGHAYGFAHNADSDSIMYGTNSAAQLRWLPGDDIDDAAGVYGNSGSEPVYAARMKTSTYAKMPKGVSSGLVTIGGGGEVKLFGNNRRPHTALDVTASDAFIGKLPAQMWAYGGTFQHPKYGSVTGGNPRALYKDGTRWFVQVRDRDNVLLEAFPVAGGVIDFGELGAGFTTDDVDGGSKAKVGASALKERTVRK